MLRDTRECRIGPAEYRIGTEAVRPGLNAPLKASLRRMDASRGDWWLVRRDEWERGRWEISPDPHGPWDWRWKLGSSKCRAVRVLHATLERQQEKLAAARKLQTLRAIVDSIRR